MINIIKNKKNSSRKTKNKKVTNKMTNKRPG
jgi:hypothetical protein